jgi:hypothetical protein
MNRKCPIAVTCPGPEPGLEGDSPVANYTAEIPDTVEFDAFVWPIFNGNNTLTGTSTTGNFPPWLAAGCEGLCVSFLSFDDAQLCAQRQSYICAHTPPTGPPSTFSFSAPTSCSYLCPDGSLFVFNVGAGAFVNLDQATANAMAHDFACQRAAANHVCLGTLTATACVNVPYSSTLQLLGVFPIGVEVASGTLPPGFSIVQDPQGKTATVSGTCTTPGDYTFTLLATDPNGNLHAKTFTISVLGITNIGSVPNATENTAYSFQLNGAGGVAPFSFALVSGSLPGISISSTGLMSGTPNYATANLTPYNFTVQITDANGNHCVQAGKLKVNLRPGPDWTKLNWTAYQLNQGAPPNSTIGQAIQNTASGALHDSGNFPGPNITPAAASGVSYAGPMVTARIILTVAVSGAASNTMACRVFQDGFQIGGYGAPMTSGVFTFDFAVAATLGSVFTIDDASPGNKWAQLFGGSGDLSFTWAIVNV